MFDQTELLNSRILVVDDDPRVVRFLERILAKEGYRYVLSTTDSSRVIELYREFRPDLLILDLHMPGMDGFQIIERLRAQEVEDAYLPILVLTGDTSLETRLRALGAGARDYLEKPLDLEVISRIRNALEVRRLYRKLQENNRRLKSMLDHRRYSDISAGKKELPLGALRRLLRTALAPLRRSARSAVTLKRLDRLGDRISDILDLAALRVGKVEVVEVPFRLSCLLQSVEVMVECSGPDVWVLGDPGRLRRVIQRLCEWKTDDLPCRFEADWKVVGSSAVLTLVASHWSEGSDEVAVAYKMLVQELLPFLGGKNETVEGTIRMELPVISPVFPEPVSLVEKKILIFERAETRVKLEEALRSWGAEVMTEHKLAPRDMGDILESSDLVLWDLEYENGGFEAFNNQREGDKKLPKIVFTTGAGQPGDVALAKAMGAVGYITRPTPPAQLKRFLELCLGVDTTQDERFFVTRYHLDEVPELESSEGGE